ncbi:MAG TPA: FecR family protein [Chthoniobacterales bacterium]|nr:FecR family protein [Chthoniobacterales bacterium]
MKRNHSLASRRSTAFSSVASRRKLAICALLLCVLPLALAPGAELKQARVTQVVRDVKLLPGQAAPRPATISDQVRQGTAVRTGEESRAELTFTDRTLTRLGANTIFSFDQGTRNLQLGGGAMLLRVPKDAGGARINTAAITAAITGTTMLLEYHPNAFCKFIMLEGVARIFRNNRVGESVLLRPGQMLIVNPNGKGLPDPVDVDLDRLMKTSLLITGFDPLPSLDLIAQVASEQDAKKNEGAFIDTNLAIFGSGTTVALLDPTNTNLADQANANEIRQEEETPTPTPSTPTPTPTITPTVTPTVTPTITPTVTPTATPDKFGTPSVISSPVPYVIDSSTTITTDPTITTNGVTDFGKQYRDSELDGSPSTYLFGSTSAFDNEIEFDRRIDDPDNLPAAVFKFLALNIAGDPMVALGEGGVTNLALVSVGDLTSSAPGGVLTFGPIDALLLATQEGSITLGSEISFEGIDKLFFYARGTGSTLTLDSPISGTTDLTAIAQGDIILNNPFAFTATGATDSGLHGEFIAGENLIAQSDFTITVDNSNGGDTLDHGGRITLSADNAVTIGGSSGLNLTIANNNQGHIGGDATIFLSSGTDLTAPAVNLLVNDRDAGVIDGGANIFILGGALNVDSDLTGVITTRNDGAGGGIINGDTFVELTAASIATGGFVDLAISANAGGMIPNATLLTLVTGDVVTNGGYSSEIQSTGFNVPGGPFIEGGTISGDALLLLDFGSVASGDYFDVEIDNFGLGTIGGEALLSVAVTGDLNAAGDIFADIINTAADHNEVLTPGGTIGGDATVGVFAGGDIIAGGVGEFAVLNNDLNFLSEAGSITGNASVFVDAVNLTTGGFFQPLVNNTNGSIGGDASVEVDVTGDISIGAETFFNILNSNGEIGGSALSDLFATNFTSGSTFQFQILNDGGSIVTDASLFAALGDALTIAGDAFIEIGNQGGTISGDAAISLTAPNITADSLLAQIDNTAGTIDGTASINMEVSGNATVASDATIEIVGSDGAGAAAINANGGTYNVGGTFRSTIDGDGAITFNNASVNADVLKSGVFGSNGTLTVGGGRLSGNTELKLYAPGSNGQVNFISNVTLNSESSVIIAANAVTINNGIVVTITGDDGASASVFTNVPNYSEEFGGNGSTTGTFAGNGAQTFPLDQAPPFDADFDAPAKGATALATVPAPTPTTNSNSGDRGGGADTARVHGKRGVPIARVANTDELLALLDNVQPGAAGSDGSNPTTGKKTHRASSLSLGKGHAAVQNLDRANMAPNHTGARRPAALP